MLGHVSACEYFTGLPLASPLDYLYVDGKPAVPVDTTKDSIQKALVSMRDSHAALHAKIADIKEQRRLRSKRGQKATQEANFHIGDYVVWSRVDVKTPRNKLKVTWVGPFQITQVFRTASRSGTS